MLKFVATLALCATLAAAQNANTVGTVTKLDLTTKTLSIKTDQNKEFAVTLDAKATFRRVDPDQTSLANAATIEFATIAVGDRLIATGRVDGLSIVATRLVVMSQAELPKRAVLGDWEKAEVKDNFTGEAMVQFTLRGTFLTPPRRALGRPELQLLCRSSPTAMNADSFIGSVTALSALLDAEYGPGGNLHSQVQYRLDDGAPSSETWSTSESLEFVMFQVRVLYRLMFKQDRPPEGLGLVNATRKLVLQLHEFRGGPIVIQFDLGDISQVAHACGIID